MRQITIAALIVAAASSAFAVDITSCGMLVPEGETGVLQADLAGCESAVALEQNATLQMNNHVISDCGVSAVVCQGRRCTIEGPGEVIGGGCNIHFHTSARRPRMTIRDVNMHDTWGLVGGINVVLLAQNLTVTNQLDHPNAEGGSQIAVAGYRVSGTNLTIANNIGYGLSVYRRLALTNSTITGNDGNFVGIDFYSGRPPRFEGVTCGLSQGPSGPWGVCTND